MQWAARKTIEEAEKLIAEAKREAEGWREQAIVTGDDARKVEDFLIVELTFYRLIVEILNESSFGDIFRAGWNRAVADIRAGDFDVSMSCTQKQIYEEISDLLCGPQRKAYLDAQTNSEPKA
jgi:hypothetical protein